MSQRRAGRFARSARRRLIEADQNVVRKAWLACAEIFMRVLGAYLRLGLRAAIYVRGGFGFGAPILGVSDIDLLAVVSAEHPHEAGPRLMARWRRLTRILPGLGRIVYLECYWASELEPLRRTRFTYGLDGRWPRSLLFADSPRSWRAPEHRTLPPLLPDLWPVEGWRLIVGTDLRPGPSVGGSEPSHLLTWVHLQYWWRLGLRVLGEPVAPWVAYACVKLVAESAKILLWLEHHERHVVRRKILQRGLEVLPEEEATLRFALGLLDDLASVGASPVEVVWPCFVRLSARIARRLSAELESMGTTKVRLEGMPLAQPGEGPAGPRPLGDWTALVWPPGRDESFVVSSGSAVDLAAVIAAAEASSTTSFVTLLHEGLMVRPGRLGREWFRCLDFGGTDPVSAAVLDGQSVAAFPNVAGWSASHTAMRAVAEHAAWLELPRDRTAGSATAANLAGVFSAARAALFHRSIEQEDPVLAVTFEATARLLADQLPGHRGAIEDAYESYRRALATGSEVNRNVLQAAARALQELGPYPKPFPHLFPVQRSGLAGTERAVENAGRGLAGSTRGTAGAGDGGT